MPVTLLDEAIYYARIEKLERRLKQMQKEEASITRMLKSADQTHSERLDRIERSLEALNLSERLERVERYIEETKLSDWPVRITADVLKLQEALQDLGSDGERKDIVQSVNDLWDSHNLLKAKVKSELRGAQERKSVATYGKDDWPFPQD